MMNSLKFFLVTFVACTCLAMESDGQNRQSLQTLATRNFFGLKFTDGGVVIPSVGQRQVLLEQSRKINLMAKSIANIDIQGKTTSFSLIMPLLELFHAGKLEQIDIACKHVDYKQLLQIAEAFDLHNFATFIKSRTDGD